MTEAFGHIRSSADLFAIARAMEERSAERYRDLAEAFEMSCNQDTAEAFRELAAMEDEHATAFPAAPLPHARALDWFEQAPELADPDAVHYLMLPWHAFDLALRAEERACTFFTDLAMAATTTEVRAQAHELAEREKGHVEHIRTRRDSCPEPHPGWWDDQDGPNWDAD
ncbi:MAG TPA: ferritin family protein [Magnetospirillum sp.]|jgi:rubrerythrin|nr:ferritin family protein [Magnetospirillum sp.]